MKGKKLTSVCGKREYTKPLHVYGTNGEEILKCPYKGCSKLWPKGQKGWESMSHHVAIHKKKGTPLQSRDGIGGIINMAEKYNEEENKDDEVSAIPSDQEEKAKEPTVVDLENPITAKDWEARAEKNIMEVRLNCLKWDTIADSEIAESVSYVSLVRTLAKYVKYNGIYVKCTVARLTDLVADELKNFRNTVEGAKNKVKVVEKLHKAVKEDINKALDTIVQKATVLEGVEGQFMEANYLRESADIRKQIRDDAQLTVQGAMNAGLIEFENAWNKKADTKIREVVDNTLRAREQYGLPQMDVFNKPPAVLSAEDKKEEEEAMEAMPQLSKLATRQLEATEKKVIEKKPEKPAKKSVMELLGVKRSKLDKQDTDVMKLLGLNDIPELELI